MPEKVFVSEKNIATFICPECKKSMTMDISKYKNIEQSSKVKCKCTCGHSYSVIMERRWDKRKRTAITAIYTNIISSIGTQFCEEVGRGVIKITDISNTGMMIEFNSEHTFTTKDRLIIEFNLDDKKRTLIKKEVEIKNLSGLKAGVAFCTKDPCDAVIQDYLSQ